MISSNDFNCLTQKEKLRYLNKYEAKLSQVIINDFIETLYSVNELWVVVCADKKSEMISISTFTHTQFMRNSVSEKHLSQISVCENSIVGPDKAIKIN